MSPTQNKVWLVTIGVLVLADTEAHACEQVSQSVPQMAEVHRIEATEYEAVIMGQTIARRILAEHAVEKAKAGK